jgi:hypothetical protein
MSESKPQIEVWWIPFWAARWPWAEQPEKLGVAGERSAEFVLAPWKQYHVSKMTFAKPSATQKAAGQKQDNTTIHDNSHLTLDGILLEAYDSIGNGKPALEWIMERYQITIDKASATMNPRKKTSSRRFVIDGYVDGKSDHETLKELLTDAFANVKTPISRKPICDDSYHQGVTIFTPRNSCLCDEVVKEIFLVLIIMDAMGMPIRSHKSFVSSNLSLEYSLR